MKISVITVCYNCVDTIEKTINSVISQNYKELEYIVIDGNSNDGTLEILRKYSDKICKVISERDNGIYDAINKGLKIASGDIISLLHGNDIFVDNFCLKKIADEFNKDKKLDLVISDLAFKNNFGSKKITRYYKAKDFKPWMIRIGYSPPHLSSFFKLSVIKQLGFYNKNFKIAGDFDFFVKAFLIKKINYKIINECLVFMSTGGLSGNLRSYFISSKEINNSLKLNGFYSNILITLIRFPLKMIQLIY